MTGAFAPGDLVSTLVARVPVSDGRPRDPRRLVPTDDWRVELIRFDDGDAGGFNLDRAHPR
jgi:hypothetical protein